MKLKYTLAALAATTLAANAAVVKLDNYFTEQNGATAGAVGDFGVQSFTPTTAGLGTNDSVTANSPLPSTIYLESVSFLRATSGTSDNAGNGSGPQTFVHVYLGAGDGGTYVGSATNSIDTDGAAGLSTLTWNFDSLALTSSSSQYAFVFTDNADNTLGIAGHNARLQVARDSGGGFGDSYSAGTADNDQGNGSPSGFDTRFEVTLNTVPEPSTTALLGLGGLALILRRRK